MRRAWADLDGTWTFRHDDADAGLSAGWAAGPPVGEVITVPLPPESPASGIDEPGFHPVVRYARPLTAADLAAAGRSEAAPRVLLHLGAVDYRASVWVDGSHAGGQEGGHTPFTLDITELVAGDGEHLLVVRAEDDPHDMAQPRGKQDRHEQPHAIWYHRTTGIWQTVWLEGVPTTSIERVRWTPAGHHAVDLAVGLRGPVLPGSRLRVALRFDERDEDLGTVEVTVPRGGPRVEVCVPLARQRNGQAEDELHWSPEHPRLVDATVTLLGPSGDVADEVASYLGVRTVGVAGGRFLLNNRPYDVRSVLNQGFWPERQSWGIQHVVDDPAQQAFCRALADLTRALDPSRPVVANDGWEQPSTDIVTIHDYEGDGAVLGRRYADAAARAVVTAGIAPSVHPQFVGGAVDEGQPYMLTEFGGIAFRPDLSAHGWGYTSATDAEDWLARLTSLYDGVRASTLLAGRATRS